MKQSKLEFFMKCFFAIALSAFFFIAEITQYSAVKSTIGLAVALGLVGSLFILAVYCFAYLFSQKPTA